jgi:hypothetical protein
MFFAHTEQSGDILLFEDMSLSESRTFELPRYDLGHIMAQNHSYGVLHRNCLHKGHLLSGMIGSIVESIQTGYVIYGITHDKKSHDPHSASYAVGDYVCKTCRLIKDNMSIET